MKTSMNFEELKNFCEILSIGIYFYSKDEGIVFANKSFIKMLNTTKENVFGFAFINFLNEKGKAELIKYANLVFDGQINDVPWPMEEDVFVDGTKRYIRIYPQIININNTDYILGFVLDVTEENKLKNLKLKKQVDEDNRIMSLLDRFNNLLTGILGYSSLLSLKEKRNEEKEIIKKIYDTAMEASNIINSIVPKRNSKEYGVKGSFLVADEDSISLSILKDILTKEQYSVIPLEGDNILAETLKNIDKTTGIFVDIYIPKLNTFGYISDILNYRKDIPVILMAHEKELEEVQDIISVHDVYFLQKPIEEENVLNLLKLIERS